MRRFLPVFFVSLVVNLFLFLMMHRMVAGEQYIPGKKADLQGVEFIRLKHQPPLEREERRTAPKLPVLQKPPPPKPLPEITKKPAPQLKKVQQIQPTIQRIKPLLHLSRTPYLGDFVSDPPPPPVVEAVPVQEVTVDPLMPESEEVAEASKVIEKKEASTIETSEAVEASFAGEIEIDVTPLVRVAPRYPRRAVKAKLEGVVKVAFTIAKDGSVTDLHVVASDPPDIFDQAALGAIRKWKFSPKKISGKPVVRRALQNIHFSLR